MRKGLVYIWASATAAMFFLYLSWNVLTPILGYIDGFVAKILWNIVGTDTVFYGLYNEWTPRLRDFFGYFSLVSFISLLIYVVVNSARREPQEYYI